MIPRELHDGDGQYLGYRRLKRAAIDACFLRVNKDFCKNYTQNLYATNTFSFRMAEGSCRMTTPRLLSDAIHDRRTVLSSRRQPSLSAAQIRTAFECFVLRSPVAALPDFVHHDPFLRFLHSIGPSNAALLKSMQFGGVALIEHTSAEHNNPNAEWLHCDHALLSSLRIYIPFIRKFCTSVGRIVIHTLPDDRAAVLLQNLAPQSNNEPKQLTPMEQALREFFEVDIRQITSLKEVVLLDTWDKPNFEEIIIKPTIDFLKERTNKRDGELWTLATMATTARYRKNLASTCAFCAEDHIWPECHNLCSYCGDFGHWRKSCAKCIADEFDAFAKIEYIH